MVLRTAVAVGVSLFCLWQGFSAASVPSPEGRHYFPIVYVLSPVLLLAGLSRRGLVTWPIASLLLLFQGHWLVGWIPAGLVVFNLIGNRTLGSPAMSRSYGTGVVDQGRDDVNVHFVRYCRAFLYERCGLTEVDAQLLLLDPELGPPMDTAKRSWVWHDLAEGEDPDDYLLPLAFDAPEMERINAVLRRFAEEFEVRVQRIREYLRSTGHPLA